MSSGATVAGQSTIAKDDAVAADRSNGHKRWTQYTVISNPPASFTLSTSPSAGGFLEQGYMWDPDAENFLQTSSANVQYSVTPTSVTLDLIGTTKVGGVDKILIGQGCGAVLTGIPLDWNVQYNWSVSGTTYGGFTVHYNGNVVGAGGPDPLPSDFASRPAPFWYWKDDGDKLVSCTASVTLPDASAITISATKNVTAVAPYADIKYADPMGTVKVFIDGTFGLYVSDAQSPGMNISGWVNTPQEFITAANDPGVFCFVQKAQDNVSWTDSSGVTHQFNRNNVFGLDNGDDTNGAPATYWQMYGYTNQAMGDSSNDASWLHVTDAPTLFLSHLPQVISATRSFSASTWLMYLPPGTSTWVPLYKVGWNFSGTASGPAPSNNGRYFPGWSISDSNADYTSKMWLPEFPAWTSVLSQIRGYTPP